MRNLILLLLAAGAGYLIWQNYQKRKGKGSNVEDLIAEYKQKFEAYSKTDWKAAGLELRTKAEEELVKLEDKIKELGGEVPKPAPEPKPTA